MNKKNFKKHIVIGSANFTQKYGRNKNQLKQFQIKKILKLAKNNNIYKIDTAQAYIENKNNFIKLEKKFEFYTKIIPNSNWSSIEYCQNELNKHFSIFNNHKVDVLFFHDVNILLNQNGHKIFNNLKELKKRNLFKKIGISIYDPNFLSKIISKYNVDVVQVPFNVFDKRIIESGWYDKLKNLGIEIHARSIFLQGLLVNKLFFKKKYFRQWKTLFLNWFKYLEKNRIPPVDYCMSDLLNYDFDKIIIGINSHKNLKEIIDFKIVKKNQMKNFTINDKNLIDPRYWK